MPSRLSFGSIWDFRFSVLIFFDFDRPMVRMNGSIFNISVSLFPVGTSVSMKS